MSSQAFTAETVAEHCERIFGRIHVERMADVPILNTALRVEAVGFRPWDGGFMGILITPWFMNVLYVPGSGKEHAQAGVKTDRHLPSGEYEFIGAFEEELGDYEMCSLFSPMAQFHDHAAARETARAAMHELFQPKVDAAQARTVDNLVSAPVSGRTVPLNRRDFLRGKFLHGGK
jgi:[NiFe] hydrogenase assembly HybE family chaperone